MSELYAPAEAVRDAVATALREDLLPLGDLTSALLPAGVQAVAAFVPRADGVLAGRPCVDETFRQIDAAVTVEWIADDGDRLAIGDRIGVVRGSLASILTAERTALNFLTHLSGVATATRRFVEAAAGRARIWDTRKTTPGLRALEKAAVRAGGGSNHRGNLSDWVLLKDNHLTVLGIADGVKRARERWPGRTVHVECERREQVEEAVAAGADAILLDNMSVELVSECVGVARSAPQRVLLEVSGTVTLDLVPAYAATGIDLISTSAITMSAPNFDIGLDVVVEPG